MHSNIRRMAEFKHYSLCFCWKSFPAFYIESFSWWLGIIPSAVDKLVTGKMGVNHLSVFQISGVLVYYFVWSSYLDVNKYSMYISRYYLPRNLSAPTRTRYSEYQYFLQFKFGISFAKWSQSSLQSYDETSWESERPSEHVWISSGSKALPCL